MKKIFFLTACIAALSFNAQVNRFVYQVTMKSDAENKNDVKTENAYLDISKEKSQFYSENRIKRDSVMQAMFQSGGARNFNREQMEGLRTNIDYSIEKDKSTQKVTYKNRIGRDIYSYEEERPISWKMLSETTKIGDYKVQKAETDFAGRKWTAWFTTDLPYQDGPYKFAGLPGLIVKIEDDKAEYSFDLMRNYKVADFPETNRFGNTMKVKRSDYNKQLEKFRKDPQAFMSAQNTGGGGGIRIGAPSPPMSRGGGNQNSAEMRKRREERMKEEMKRNSNPIELN